MLKGRFPCLKNLNMKIKKEEDILICVRVILTCCILHNFLLSDVDTRMPQEWYDERVIESFDEDDPEMNSREQLSEQAFVEDDARRTQVVQSILHSFNYIH